MKTIKFKPWGFDQLARKGYAYCELADSLSVNEIVQIFSYSQTEYSTISKVCRILIMANSISGYCYCALKVIATVKYKSHNFALMDYAKLTSVASKQPLALFLGKRILDAESG